MRRADRQSFGGTATGGVVYAPPYGMGFSSPQVSRDGFQQASAAGVRQDSSGLTEIGSLFRQLRQVLGLSLPQVASLLQTRIDTVSALERGDVPALPEWSETARIVSRYTALAQIDAGPALSLLRRNLEQRGRTGAGTKPRQRQKDVPARGKEPSERWNVFKAAFLQPFAEAASSLTRRLAQLVAEMRDIDAPDAPRPSRFSRLYLNVPRLDARKTAGLVAALFVIVGYFAQGSALQASLATLHPPIAKLMRGAQNYLFHRSAPVRDGLRWIEVDDPRSRKADKLAVRR